MKALNACRQILAKRQSSLMIVLLILGLGLFVTSVVAAQNSGGGMVRAGSSPEAIAATPVPVQGGPGYVVLMGADFRPYTPTNTNYSLIGFSLKNIDTVEQYFFAPLQIPNRATVKKMVVFFIDQDIAQQLEVSLLKVYLSENFGTVMAGVPSVNTAGVGYGQTTTITNPVIDLSNNAYSIQLRMPASSNILFYSVRIDYAYEANLPVINK
jgi:hypothetical protein